MRLANINWPSQRKKKRKDEKKEEETEKEQICVLFCFHFQFLLFFAPFCYLVKRKKRKRKRKEEKENEKDNESVIFGFISFPVLVFYLLAFVFFFSSYRLTKNPEVWREEANNIIRESSRRQYIFCCFTRLFIFKLL